MEKRKRLIQKLSNLINEEETLNEISEIFNSELDSEIVKYNSSFKNHFFAKTDCSNNSCKVKYSQTIFDIIGYPAKQIEDLPNKLNSIIHEDDRLRVENGLNLFFENTDKYNFSISYRVIKENDNEVYLNETISAVRNKTGKVEEYNSIFFDVSEMENKKKEVDDFSNEMINVNRKKDKFISIVSHDLKSPYTTLLGFSEILLNDASLPDEEKREYIEYIHKSSKHQLNFIEHLLDWSRLRTGRTVIEDQRLNLKNIISTIVSRFTGIAVRKNIEISQNVQSDIFVKSDEKQLSKAISDLLQNAIVFSKKNSSIFIYGSRFKDGMIEIIVKDKGIGISAADHEKLFKLDQKHSREGTEGEQGSGMGLILVKEIMEKLRGDVWFYSKENEGSEFHITLPEAQNIVLLVDDNMERLNDREKLFSEALPNYLLLKASNGYAALDFINEELPSLIITKEELPLMCGDEIIKAVRNKDKYFAVSVFILTDEDNEITEEKYGSLVVDGVYQNNIETEKLIKIIKQNIK
ncbi:MAG: ATP-binding protein [Melioribacteraceae bacterium]|jgi:signal transduction histidine kinase/CheY-like chemotaxis protein|nr:ATP-binding protein [Melioribacteraceae bacterium]